MNFGIKAHLNRLNKEIKALEAEDSEDLESEEFEDEETEFEDEEFESEYESLSESEEPNKQTPKIEIQVKNYAKNFPTNKALTIFACKQTSVLKTPQLIN